MRGWYLERHVRHWRRLLAVADTDHFSADALRESLADLDAAIADGHPTVMKLRLAEVRLAGRALEESLREG
jgi:hypothetical protein